MMFISKRAYLLLLLAALYPAAAAAQHGSAVSETVIPLPTRVIRCTQFEGSRSVPAGPKIGLVLSGGGSRGLSQIGVLRALEEMGVRPDVIVGTSIGSILGGLYACGYNADDLERVMTSMDWPELLRLSDEGDRRSMPVEQKPLSDRSVFTLRLDGLQPVLPISVSVGQRLTNELTTLAIQGLYHEEDFDNFPIVYRAVATDLYSGERVVLSTGNIAEAMRASATVPLVYAPVQRDSMLLVDGGLRSNLPADVARELGCDVVIAVNCTSPLRSRENLGNAVETLDQMLTILMQDATESQLALCDLVITPPLGQHLSSDFGSVQALIDTGYASAVAMRQVIEDTLLAAMGRIVPLGMEDNAPLRITGPDGMEVRGSARDVLRAALFPEPDIARAELALRQEDTGAHAVFRVQRYGEIATVEVRGNSLLEEDSLRDAIRPWLGTPLSPGGLQGLCAAVLREYRRKGYSLARIESASTDTVLGAITLSVSEGRIGSLEVSGNVRTNEIVILREFPLKVGSVFRIADAQLGMRNILGLGLFHHVSFDVEQLTDPAHIRIRVVERPSQLFEVGLRADNERFAQIGLELRDANLLGTGASIAAMFFGGTRNRYYGLRYNSNRIFYTPLNFAVGGYYDLRDFNEYQDVTDLPSDRFERTATSTNRVTRYGGDAGLGLYVQRFGNLYARLRFERQGVRTVSVRSLDAEIVQENHMFAGTELGTVIDSQDRFPYPNSGLLLDLYYKSAQKALGSDIAFIRFETRYEQYFQVGYPQLVLHPRVQFGYGDLTLPVAEEFRLGGLHSFYGMRENEFNGRQLFVGSLEMRYLLPIDIFFDSYLSFRYDIGRTWAQPEEIHFKDLRHGAGLALGLDTPIGPADFAIGQSFYFLTANAPSRVRRGPLNLYFSIGVSMP